jgi:hypothetical protein
MNKKSIIQLFVLVILIVVAGGAYFVMQEGSLEGGLNAVTKLVSEFTGAKAPEPPKPAAPAAPTIPPTPAKGFVAGKPFALSRAYVENGWLVLLSGGDKAEVGVAIALGGKSWDVPANRNLKLLTAAANSSTVRASWKEGDAGDISTANFNQGYTLVLELGAVADRKIPGKLALKLPDAKKSEVAGTFTAELQGFYLVGDKADLSVDKVDTLEWLALQDVLKAQEKPNDTPPKLVQDVKIRESRMTEATDPNPSGFLEMEYKVGDAPIAIERFQFAKDKGEWKIRGKLPLTKIDEANPVKAPGAKDPVAKVLAYQAAKRLEGDLAKQAPKKGVFEVSFNTRTNDAKKIGQAEVSYRVEGAESAKKIYLFAHTPKGWQLQRPLKDNEKINFDTGKIETAKAAKK